ncbi:MAG: Lrp/AsnC ligand binding domain-containing protein [Candidatus Omnitrophota bacterium]|nr:Lrp/AsnC ligand binding domain-containing protein [Candidatus Omnitrophota bacterium]
MAIRAYVLINLVTSDLSNTMLQLREIREIKNADAVIGPYDCIAEIEADSMDMLGNVVVNKILKIDGVAKTLTCVKL